MTENQNRVQAGIPTGGQYAATAHSDAVPSLEAAPRTTHTAQLNTTIELHSDAFTTLPEWPGNLPEPEVNFGFDDGRAETYVTIDGKMKTFWTASDMDGILSGDDVGSANRWEDFDYEDQEMAMEWAREVHKRIDSSTYGIMSDGSHAPAVNEIILAHALDREPKAAAAGPDLENETTRNAYVIAAAARLAKANEELQKVYMIGAAQELHAICPEIDSFELTVDEKGRLELQAAYDVDGNPLSGRRIYDASHEVFRYKSEDDYSTFLDGRIITVADAIAFRPSA